MTMLDMAKKDILPAVTKYSKMLAETASLKASVGEMISCEAEVTQLKNISALSASLFHKIEALDSAVMGAKEHESDSLDTATYYKDSVLPAMQELRAVADALEMLVGGEFWPFPTYGELLFSV
ncbi:MAG: hypothetical protein DBX47_01060 [Clostridiales bacterium]|nr:MAG: hypothetical protein DBX47_01060 [Clostridiales bacterium]